MARTKAKIIRTEGSVLVGVRDPNAVLPVPPMERAYSDWTDIATEIASDATVSTPDTLTTQPHETTPSVSSVDEIRVYRVNADGKLYRVYTGEYTADIDERCQLHANLSGRVVWLFSATDAVPFDPAVPSQESETPPTEDIESNTVAVYNDNTSELLWVGNETKGFASRCQELANAEEITLKVVSNGGQLTRFYVPHKLSLAYARENAKRMQKALEVAGEVLSLVVIGVVGLGMLIVL